MSEIVKQLTHQLKNGDIDIETFTNEYDRVKRCTSDNNLAGCNLQQQKKARYNNSTMVICFVMYTMKLSMLLKWIILYL